MLRAFIVDVTDMVMKSAYTTSTCVESLELLAFWGLCALCALCALCGWLYSEGWLRAASFSLSILLYVFIALSLFLYCCMCLSPLSDCVCVDFALTARTGRGLVAQHLARIARSTSSERGLFGTYNCV